MSQYAIIFQVLGVLLALFFIFLTYMNTKTWRWVHVTMTFFVFAASIAFCVYAAMAMKTRLAWLEYHDDLDTKVAQVATDLELVTQGDIKDVEGKTASITSVRAELARTILDRGRVWRQLVPAPNADGSATLSTAPPPDPNVPAPAAPKKHNLEPKTIVFAFKEAPNAEGIMVPAFYLGEYQVTAVAEMSVTVAPSIPQTAPQQAAARDPNGTWVLYEVCPIDGRDWLTADDPLTALIPQPQTGLSQAEYDKLIALYQRDGQPAEETDPPDNVWIEVKFTRPHTVQVDAAAVNSVDSDPFDASGQAVLDRLRRAKAGENPASVEFEVGDTAIFDQETANNLVGLGVAEKVRPIFRRKLNDYELRFHAIHRRIVEINGRLQALALDKAATEVAIAKAAEQETALQDLKTKLTEDVDKVQFELAELTKYSESVTARLTAVQAELSMLYRSNKALSRELAETSARLTEEIDRRTREATARN